MPKILLRLLPINPPPISSVQLSIITYLELRNIYVCVCVCVFVCVYVCLCVCIIVDIGPVSFSFFKRRSKFPYWSSGVLYIPNLFKHHNWFPCFFWIAFLVKHFNYLDELLKTKQLNAETKHTFIKIQSNWIYYKTCPLAHNFAL